MHSDPGHGSRPACSGLSNLGQHASHILTQDNLLGTPRHETKHLGLGYPGQRLTLILDNEAKTHRPKVMCTLTQDNKLATT